MSPSDFLDLGYLMLLATLIQALVVSVLLILLGAGHDDLCWARAERGGLFGGDTVSTRGHLAAV